MALRQLLLASRLQAAKIAADEHRAKKANFEERRAEIERRTAAAEKALDELTTDATEEERAAFEAEVEAIEAAENSLNTDITEHEAEQTRLDALVSQIEADLGELEQRTKQRLNSIPEPTKKNKKEDFKGMTNRTTKFFGMTTEQRDAFFSRDDVKEFICRVRELRGQNRAITGAELLIPDIALGIIRENIGEYSKLLKHVNLRAVSGRARQRIAGTIPEAVWTEACANLNELDLSFTFVDLDGWKVGGYIPVCNALLEDSDIALGSEIMTMLAAAIGRGIDKAILYGTGVKMPMGIATRLKQESDPGSINTDRPWVDLTESNVIAIGNTDATGAELYSSLIMAASRAKNKYGTGGKFWAMSEATYYWLVAHLLSISASGALVSGMNNVLPIIGGAVELLDFIPEGIIIGGYGEMYLMLERADTRLEMSTEHRFIQDQTVFRGTARYDGLPVIPEAFVMIGLPISDEGADFGDMTFPEDVANSNTADNANTANTANTDNTVKTAKTAKTVTD